LTSSQNAKNGKKICKNLFDILAGIRVENEINAGFYVKMKFKVDKISKKKFLAPL